MNASDPVLEQETQKKTSATEIQTDSPIQARRLGLIVVNGYVSNNEFQCARSPSKSRSKRNWKRDKYFDLTREDMLWNMEMSVMLIEQTLQKIRGTGKFGSIQIIYAEKNHHIFKSLSHNKPQE